MKKLLAYTLAFLLLLSFTACAQDGQTGQSSSIASSSASVSVFVPELEPEPEPEPEPAFAMGPLRIPTRWAGNLEGGMLGLDLSPLSDDNAILLQVDYESLTESPICAIDGCRHKGESCAAYKPRESTFSELFSMANGYFILHDELIVLRQYEPTRKEHSKFTLERMNADNTAREVFVEIPGKLYGGTTLVTDDKWLFLDVYNYGDAVDSPLLQMAPEETCLLRIDLETGAVEKMRDMKNRSLLGCDGDALIMWSFDMEPAETVAWRPQFDEEVELPLIPDVLNGDDFSGEQAAYNGVQYYVRTPEGENARLLGWRPTSGEVVLDIELPHDDCTLGRAIDGYLLASNDGAYYYIRLETGEIITPPLLAEEGEGKPARIVAAPDDRYIVISAYQMRTVNNFGMSQRIQDEMYAAISKVDYWAGEANYTPITMWRG